MHTQTVTELILDAALTVSQQEIEPIVEKFMTPFTDPDGNPDADDLKLWRDKLALNFRSDFARLLVQYNDQFGQLQCDRWLGEGQ